MTRYFVQGLIACAALAAPLASVTAEEKNGFDLTGAVIPADEIVRGGPPRDGIPALTNPQFVPAASVKMKDSARVLGVYLNGAARAYPVNMLTVHEIVNDSIGTQFFAVTYCPLCGSGVVFATNIGSVHLNFGVSGLLYNSDMLLYDRNTESLWSQLTGSAIAGKLVGTKLPVLPVRHTTWAAWVDEHPDTLVMQGDERMRRAYRSNPYPGYERSRQLYFPVNEKAPRRYHPKERVLGIQLNGVARAYPFAELEAHGRSEFTDDIGDTAVRVRWDSDSESAWAIDADGAMIATTTLYWFAWYAFHPDTEVFHAGEE